MQQRANLQDNAVVQREVARQADEARRYFEQERQTLQAASAQGGVGRGKCREKLSKFGLIARDLGT